MKIAIYENTGERCGVCHSCHTGKPCHSEKPVYIGTGEDFAEAYGEFAGARNAILTQFHRASMGDFLSTFKKEAEEKVSLCCGAGMSNEGRCMDCGEFTELLPTE